MAKRKCTVAGCPELIDRGQSRCTKHERAARRQRSDPPGRHQHRRVRAELLPLAYGQACPLCHQPMLPGQPLDLDHTTPRAEGNTGPGDRMAHATCNRSSGGLLGYQIGNEGA